MTTRVSLNYSDDPDSVEDIDDHAFFRQADTILGNPGRYSHNHMLGATYDQEAEQFLQGERTARRALAQFALQPDNFLGHNPRILAGGNPREYTAGWQRIPGYDNFDLSYGNELPLSQPGRGGQQQQGGGGGGDGESSYVWATATR